MTFLSLELSSSVTNLFVDVDPPAEAIASWSLFICTLPPGQGELSLNGEAAGDDLTKVSHKLVHFVYVNSSRRTCVESYRWNRYLSPRSSASLCGSGVDTAGTGEGCGDIGGWCPGYIVLLLYMFHRFNRDTSKVPNPAASLGGVEGGGDALSCRWIVGGGVPLLTFLSSLFNSFTYSTMRASNSAGAIPGIGPADRWD